MRIRTWWALPVSTAILAGSLLLPAAASAHEQRDVGKYHFVVGFLNEPAIQDQMNSIDLTVTTTADKQPVAGVEKTLKAEVIVGGNAASMPISLEPRFGLPGKYAGYFMPTATGSYQFHFTGTINGDAVDQKFESGPNTFSDVNPIAPLQFPQKLGDRRQRKLSWPTHRLPPARLERWRWPASWSGSWASPSVWPASPAAASFPAARSSLPAGPEGTAAQPHIRHIQKGNR